MGEDKEAKDNKEEKGESGDNKPDVEDKPEMAQGADTTPPDVAAKADKELLGVSEETQTAIVTESVSTQVFPEDLLPPPPQPSGAAPQSKQTAEQSTNTDPVAMVEDYGNVYWGIKPELLSERDMAEF